MLYYCWIRFWALIWRCINKYPNFSRSFQIASQFIISLVWASVYHAIHSEKSQLNAIKSLFLCRDCLWTVQLLLVVLLGPHAFDPPLLNSLLPSSLLSRLRLYFFELVALLHESQSSFKFLSLWLIASPACSQQINQLSIFRRPDYYRKIDFHPTMFQNVSGHYLTLTVHDVLLSFER